jgi:glycine/D-amino acid oxidase-like deaminating enzyme
MPKTKYGISYWLDQFPASRAPSFPRHRGLLDIDVAIVGGGLTGCVTAYVFAAAGVKVALFNDGRIGEGATASSFGLLRQETDPEFQHLVSVHGLRVTRHLWQSARRGSLDLAAAIRRLDLKCQLTASPAFRIAGGGEPKQMRREQEARRGAGFGQVWLRPEALKREAAILSAGAIRVGEEAQVDPYRAALGFARAASDRGAQIFTQSRMVRVRAGRKAVEARTDRGTVRAARIIFTTGSAPGEIGALARHLDVRETFAVATPPIPAKIRRETGRAPLVLRDANDPPHLLRWTSDGRILFSGADGDPVPARHREKLLVQRTGQLMYELSLLYPGLSGLPAEYGWSAPIALTADGLPYIGPHRNFPRHLFALGFGRNGVGLSFLAARVLLRRHTDEAEKGDEMWGFGRLLGE